MNNMNKYTERQIEIIEAATERIDRFGIQNFTIKNLAGDIGLSEPALYRHFGGKNEILVGLLDYFSAEMKNRLSNIISTGNNSVSDELRAIFKSQLQTFSEKPAIVSVIFAEGIFHFNEELSGKVSEIMKMMSDVVKSNIKKGQDAGEYAGLINSSTLATIIIGGMRMTVLKWKLTGHKSNLVKDGSAIVEGVLKMIEK